MLKKIATVLLLSIGVIVGIGLFSLLGQAVSSTDFPFRMMWFAHFFGFLVVLIVSITAAMISVRPMLKMEPAMVFFLVGELGF